MEIAYAIISKTVTDGSNITNVNTESRLWHFRWHIYIQSLPILKGQVRVMHISSMNNLQTMTRREKMLLQTNRKPHTAFSLVCLQMILVNSKGHGHGQGRAHFDWEYL